MKSPSNIAVVGKMHSGKTTIARFLVNTGYHRISFADPVKEVSAEMLSTFCRIVRTMQAGPNDPIIYRHYDYTMINEMKGHPAIRSLLQLVGTGLGRDWYGPDTIWIDMFEKKVQKWESDRKEFPMPVVNDDCRFPNEAERLRKLEFTIIKLVRNDAERCTSIYNALVKQNPTWTPAMIHEALLDMQEHPSETNVDNIQADYTIRNINLDQLRAVANTFGSMAFHKLPNEWFL